MIGKPSATRTSSSSHIPDVEFGLEEKVSHEIFVEIDSICFGSAVAPSDARQRVFGSCNAARGQENVRAQRGDNIDMQAFRQNVKMP